MVFEVAREFTRKDQPRVIKIYERGGVYLGVELNFKLD
jgi:hypothetical protein